MTCGALGRVKAGPPRSLVIRLGERRLVWFAVPNPTSKKSLLRAFQALEERWVPSSRVLRN